MPDEDISVCEVQKTGWVNKDPAGSTLFKNVDVDDDGPVTQPAGGLNFGNAQGTISGVKYNDLNADGEHSHGDEPGLAGMTRLSLVRALISSTTIYSCVTRRCTNCTSSCVVFCSASSSVPFRKRLVVSWRSDTSLCCVSAISF